METGTVFILGDSKITADVECNHEIKRCLLLGGKTMTNLDSIIKSRDITLPTKVCTVKSMVFPVVMYGCESWTLNAKELMILNCGVKSSRLLRVPWNARRSKQSILKEIIPEYSSEGLLLKPEAPILWPHDANNWLIRKDWFRERSKAGGEGNDRGWDGWIASPIQRTWVWASSGSWW